MRRRREEVELDEGAPATEGLAAEVDRRADLRMLVRDVQRLPPDERAALVLFEVGDHSHKEIAAVLGEDERRPLIGGKALDVADEHAQVARPSTSAASPSVAGAPSSRLVARDGVEPGLDYDDLVARPQGAIGGQESVLQDVLGLLARAEHVRASVSSLR